MLVQTLQNLYCTNDAMTLFQGSETVSERTSVEKQALLLFTIAKKKVYSSDLSQCAMLWVPYASLIDLHDRCALSW